MESVILQCFCVFFLLSITKHWLNQQYWLRSRLREQMIVNSAICCHHEVNMKTADKTAEPGWKCASGLDYPSPALPVHPQSPHPSLALNWHILQTHSAIPPSVCPLPVNSWTSETLRFLRKNFQRSGMLLACKYQRFRIHAHFLEHTFSAGISTVSLMASDPCRMVPVMTVPWPRMEKQWSTAISRSPPGSLWGRYVCFFKSWHRQTKGQKHIYLHTKDNCCHNVARSHTHTHKHENR